MYEFYDEKEHDEETFELDNDEDAENLISEENSEYTE
jgi:hypothetical protein